MSARPRFRTLAWLLVPLAITQMGVNCGGRMIDAIPAVTGLTAPIFVTAPRNNPRLFIVERGGLIRLANPATGAINSSPFLDIRSRIASGGEQGLLGMAFDPNFAANGRFYAYFIETGTLDSVVARYTLPTPTSQVASPGTEQVILRVDQPGATNHKGGTIAFSPVDGFLYVALGDGGSDPNTAQNGSSLLGKMLRLNVSGAGAGYTIPSSNPFVSNPNIRDEIWALGFRNPFRFSFDRTNGTIWIADVGQSALEEVNREPAGSGGRNYGWPVHEGTNCYNSGAPGGPCENPSAPARFTFPVTQYGHDAGCSITGGTAYRGAGPWQNVYFYADFCSDRFYGLLPNNRVSEFTATLAAQGAVFNGITAIGEDGFGEIYIANLNSGVVHYLDLGAPE
jgi:glucose/arabinose dehydrogenase